MPWVKLKAFLTSCANLLFMPSPTGHLTNSPIYFKATSAFTNYVIYRKNFYSLPGEGAFAIELYLTHFILNVIGLASLTTFLVLLSNRIINYEPSLN